jgi:hypothetical protein
MKLYIRIVDGKPFEHPIFSENFVEAFPDIDTNNLPPEFANFVRIEPPILGAYEKNQTVFYQLVNGVYTDVFSCEQMSAEEIMAKQDAIKAEWEQYGFPSWTFDETTCAFIPPIQKPIDGKKYRWDETKVSWIEII